MAKKTYICTGCHKCTEPCTVELSGDADMTKDPTKLMHCGTWVEVPAEEDTNKEQLPKLTVEVFSLSDCPLWAKYAAVDENGKAYWYDEKPMLSAQAWSGTGTHFARQVTHDNTMTRMLYDSSDWRSSLIERHAEKQLPKLTVDVFSLDDCPDWAQYAALDANGLAYWYEDKPERLITEWQSNERARQIGQDYDASGWKNSLIERPKSEQRPKLTVEVFSMEECPEEAKYAAVDADGTAYWYEDKPEQLDADWQSYFGRTKRISQDYAASDWKNSLIERPVEKRLPRVTASVFCLSECPEWAQYVAVDSDGVAYWYADKPELNRSLRGWNNTGEHNVQRLTLHYDSTDWEHSLIGHPDTNRPELTHTVFILSDTPAWAQYAAVDAHGTAHWFSSEPAKPAASDHIWRPRGCSCHARISGAFAARNWRDSCICRNHIVKLTEEIFNHPECPADAVVAVVNSDGTAAWGNRADITLSGSGGFRAVYYSNYDTWTTIPGGACFDATDWQHSPVYKAGADPKCTEPAAPKLTHDVFSCSNPNGWTYVIRSQVEHGKTYTRCPEWARYAAVDQSGAVCVYDTKPVLRSTDWYPDSGGRCAVVCNADKLALRFDTTGWKNSLIERPAEEQLPKLTAEVFARLDCPSWARYAAVDADGTAYWYENEPIRSSREYKSPGTSQCIYISAFDATDWEHSLIERHAVSRKLTIEVFSMDECPAWARYAAVDANGFGYWYAEKPEFMRNRRGWIGASEHNTAVPITRWGTRLLYDDTDWQHSLIERPTAVPKLTADVFSMEECPNWARYTAVDADGVAYWYEVPPRLCTASHRWESNGLRTKRLCHPGSSMSILFDVDGWKNSLIERQPAEPRQKLTTEVFSMPECPEWARYAAVDASGLAYWYDAVPRWSTNGLRWQSTGTRAMKICYAGEVAVPLFDATDWQHSSIERPAAVPDWFKPGALACNMYTHTCFHVTYSTEYCENYLEAKVRPFSADELARKLGQCVLGPNNSRLLVTGYCAEGCLSGKPEICVLGDKWLTAEELLTYGSRPQGIKQYHSKEGTWIDCGLSS